MSVSNPLQSKLAGCNLYLVGMMGCGKSRTGPFLANKINYGFVDADSVIVELAGKSIEEIFQESGEDGFRQIETQVMKSIGERHSLVVSTGGGVVIKTENWGTLHQGIVIWIDPGNERILNRLQSDSSKRPLLNISEQEKDFEELFALRKNQYAQADLHIKVGEESAEEVAMMILHKLSSLLTS